MIAYNPEHVFHHAEISDENFPCREANVNQLGVLLPKWKAAAALSVLGLQFYGAVKEAFMDLLHPPGYYKQYLSIKHIWAGLQWEDQL